MEKEKLGRYKSLERRKLERKISWREEKKNYKVVILGRDNIRY